MTTPAEVLQRAKDTIRKVHCPVCNGVPDSYTWEVDEGGVTDYWCPNEECIVADFTVWWNFDSRAIAVAMKEETEG